VTLYARQLLPLGKARKLAGLPRGDFEAMFGDRQGPRDYTRVDLDEHVAYARGDASPEVDESEE